MGEKRKEQVYIKQVSWIEFIIEVILQKSNDFSIWKNLLISNAFQLLAIWIMLLLQFVTEHKFSSNEYIGNLLVFDIAACATNIADIFGDDNPESKKMSTFFTISVFILIICLASVLYCLSLIYGWKMQLQIKEDKVMFLSIIFTLLVILMGLGNTVKRR